MLLAAESSTGRTLPGDVLPARFWWQTGKPVEADLTQFFHLFHQDSDYVSTFDQPPYSVIPLRQITIRSSE